MKLYKMYLDFEDSLIKEIKGNQIKENHLLDLPIKNMLYIKTKQFSDIDERSDFKSEATSTFSREISRTIRSPKEKSLRNFTPIIKERKDYKTTEKE
jgi:hypothetical protein